MHAYIVTGATSEARSRHIDEVVHGRNISPHDKILITPEPTSIGIEQIRSLHARLSLRPLGGTAHTIVIHAAHAMTPEAQNAFLKTLEEPPGEAIIYLETNQPDALLPTVLSRCHIIRLAPNIDRVQPCQSHSDELPQCMKTIVQLLSSSMGERLKIIDITIKTRDDALAFVNQSIQVLNPYLRVTGPGPVSDPTPLQLSQAQTAQLLRRLLTARTQILGNITPKLALDAVFLS